MMSRCKTHLCTVMTMYTWYADGTVLQTKHRTGNLTSSGDGNSNEQVQVQCAYNMYWWCTGCVLYMYMLYIYQCDVTVCHVKEVYFSLCRE